MVIKTSGVRYGKQDRQRLGPRRPASFKFDRGRRPILRRRVRPKCAMSSDMHKDVRLKWFDFEQANGNRSRVVGLQRSRNPRCGCLSGRSSSGLPLSMEAGPAIVTLRERRDRARGSSGCAGEPTSRKDAEGWSMRQTGWICSSLPKGAVEDVIGDGNAQFGLHHPTTARDHGKLHPAGSGFRYGRRPNDAQEGDRYPVKAVVESRLPS